MGTYEVGQWANNSNQVGSDLILRGNTLDSFHRQIQAQESSLRRKGHKISYLKEQIERGRENELGNPNDRLDFVEKQFNPNITRTQ